MRKRLIEPLGSPAPSSKEGWLDLQELADVEVTSEAPGHPIESVFSPENAVAWKAASPGPQTIRLIFHRPCSIKRIKLEFSESGSERTQEFALRCTQAGKTLVELRRQQWNFSPDGATREVEDFELNLPDVTSLELFVDPDRGRNSSVATLDRWMVG